MTDKKKPLENEGAEKISRLIEIREQYKGDSAVIQRSRLLLAVSEFPVSTLEARQHLDIMHPGGRIMELRRADWNIHTIRVAEPSECGKLHNVARYILQVAAQP